MYLKNLLGFQESKEAIHKNIELKNKKLKSKVNNKEYHFGTFDCSIDDYMQMNFVILAFNLCMFMSG